MSTNALIIPHAQAAPLLGVTTRTLTEWKKGSNPPPVHKVGKRGTTTLYDAAALVRWFVEREITKRIDSESDQAIDLNFERAKLARSQRKKIDMDNAERERRLVEPAPALDMLTRLIVNTRARLLGLANKAAPHVHGCATVALTAAALKEQIYDALDELSETDIAALLERQPDAD